MIQIQIQCDRCGKTASIVNGFERLNNNTYAFQLPASWIMTTEIYCDTCVADLIKKGKESEQN